MHIAVASGKGGTGKTTVATNLAVMAARKGASVAYLDCDVEEPNGALFLNPSWTMSEPVQVSVPEVDQALCTHCGQCGAICQYSAIMPMKQEVLLFPELCHGCAGCWRVCPAGAVKEAQRATGRLDRGAGQGVAFVQGLLDVGQAMSPPVIRAVKQAAPEADLVVIDAPPGTSCPVIEAVRGADYVLLATEPTPFGLNDLKLAVEMVRALELPFGVVVNRADGRDGATHAWCADENVPILAEIPDDRRVAEAYSRGAMICDALPDLADVFTTLLDRLQAAVEAHAS